MRVFILLLGFLALAIAPLEHPAVASDLAPQHCAEMAMDSQHMPANANHDPRETCCFAVASAIDPTPAPLLAGPPIEPIRLDPRLAARLRGQSPLAEDPPPRLS